LMIFSSSLRKEKNKKETAFNHHLKFDRKRFNIKFLKINHENFSSKCIAWKWLYQKYKMTLSII